MLSDKDLEKLDKLLDKKLDTKLEEKLEKKLKPIVDDISTIKEDLAKTRKDQKILVGFFDNEYLELRKRVEKIEKHLNLN